MHNGIWLILLKLWSEAQAFLEEIKSILCLERKYRPSHLDSHFIPFI